MASARRGDRAAFCHRISLRDPAFATRADALFANLHDLPWGDLSVTATGRESTPAADRAAVLGPGARLQQTEVRWRLAGERRTAEHRPWVAVAAEGGRLVLVGTTDLPPSTGPVATPLWWAQSVSARSTGAVTVLGGPGVGVARWSTRATTAVRAVRSALTSPWRKRWDGQVVVEVPASREGFERVLGVVPGSYAGVAAVAWAAGPDPASAAVRVVVNPGVTTALAEEGVRVLLAHELTHVAVGSVDSPAPTWLVEGFADWVAYRAFPATAAAAARPVRERVAASGRPTGLPSDADFDAGSSRLAYSYAAAWLACRFLADRYGPGRLSAFYAAVDAGEPVDQAARAQFGAPLAFAVAGWWAAPTAPASR